MNRLSAFVRSRDGAVDGPNATPDREAGTSHLRVEGVAKRFGPVLAVDHVSLELPPGAFFGLLGPSGCGKTTLLRMLAGLERPDAGAILVDGQNITRLAPEHRPFNMVFQNYALFPHLSVFDNIAFGLTTDRRRRLAKAEVKGRVGEMLELVGLRGYERRYPTELSGGQAQRVAVARALIRRPRALLLDEPMAALDRNVRHQVREQLQRIHSELGTTFILVTHDQDEALSISSLIAVMRDGKVEQFDTPEVIYRKPATLFAARFVGAGSFLPARVVDRRAERVEIEASGIRFEAADGGIGESSDVVVLLRPEDLSLTEAEESLVSGPVLTSAYFGSFSEVTVETRLGIIRARDRNARQIGEVVGISWPSNAGIVYKDAGPAGDAMAPQGPAAAPSTEGG